MAKYSKNPALREKQKTISKDIAESYNKNYSPRELSILARDYPVVRELILEHSEIFKDAIIIFNGFPVCDFCSGRHEEKNCRRKQKHWNFLD